MSFKDEPNKNNLSMANEVTNKKNIEILKKDINKLSYEESIFELETILQNVQDDNISLEKINETAAALAINDYVAGKRSAEDIKKLKEVATFKESLGNKFTDNLIKIAGPGTIPTASHIESALRTTYPGRNVTRVKSTDKLEISEADKGTFILEEDTKRAFLITGANSKKQVY